MVTTAFVAPTVGAAPTEGGKVVNANTMVAYDTIQDAINAASAGDTITIPMNGSSPAVAYQESLVVPATKTGLTICGTVAVGVCAPVSTAARWESTTGGVWGNPPTPLQGQAIKLVAPGSTSHYPNSNDPTATKVTLNDITALSVDMLLESGGCSGGGVRLQIGVDTNGDGAKDGSVLVYPPTGWSCPTIGSWKHLDLFNGKWDGAVVGGPLSGTRAQTLAAGGSTPVVTMNLVYDGTTGTAWFDNERFNTNFLREAADFNCLDPNSPSCVDSFAQANTIIDANGAAGTVIDVLASGVTIQGLTVQNTGSQLAGSGIVLDGANGVIANATILGSTSPCQFTQFGVLMNGNSGTLVDSTVDSWSHSGVDVASLGHNVIARNTISRSCHSNVVIDGVSGTALTTIVGNDLRQALFQNVDIGTNRDVELSENFFGLAGNTIAIPAHATGAAIGARYNHWGSFNRSTIEAAFANDAGRAIDTSCYYLADDTTTICGPTAAFSYSPAAPVWKQTVNFVDASTAGGNSISRYAWDLGDGATSGAQSPAHAYAHSGSRTVTLTVTDAEGYKSSTSQTLAIANSAPTLAAITDATGTEGSALSFMLHAVDTENDAVTYHATGALPTGATLNANTGAFSWTPSFSQSGAYTFTFTATDGELTSSAQTANVTIVDAADHATTLSAPATQTLVEASTRSFVASAFDPDGNATTLGIASGPAWATIAPGPGAGKATITLAPPAGAMGAYTLTLVAHTAGAADVTKDVAITVTQRVGVSVAAIGPTTFTTSPGQTIALAARVTNTGLHDDTFNVTGVGLVAIPAGGSQDVSVDYVVPAGASGTVVLRATSQAITSVTSSVTYSWNSPITIVITVSDTSAPASHVNGTVQATYANGAPVVGAALRVSQSLHAVTQQTTSDATTTATDAAGIATYDFGTNAMSMLPGTHDLRVYLTVGSVTKAVLAHYDAVTAL